MSTAPEVIVARHCNMRCFALAVVTNVCITDDIDTSKEDAQLHPNSSDMLGKVSLPSSSNTGGASHSIQEEVLSVGSQQTKNIQLLFHAMMSEIAATQSSKA